MMENFLWFLYWEYNIGIHVVMLRKSIVSISNADYCGQLGNLGVGLQMKRLAKNIVNKQLWNADQE